MKLAISIFSGVALAAFLLGESSALAGESSGSTKRAEIHDPFYNNMLAYSMAIPGNWNFESAVLRGIGCGYEAAATVFRAYSADQLSGIQAIPPVYWYYSEDPRAYQSAFVQNCNKMPPISAADFANLISAKVRPGSEVDGVEPEPNAAKFMEKIRGFNQTMAASAASYGNPNPPRISGDIARIRLHYMLHGHPEEEWMTVAIQNTDSLQHTVISRPGEALRLGQARLRTSVAYVTLRRAPKGQLDRAAAQFQAIDASLHEDDKYRETYTAYIRQQGQRQIEEIKRMGAVALANGERAHEALMRSHTAFLQQLQQEGAARTAQFNANIDRRSRQVQDFNDYVLDQQYYVNPATGVRGTLPSAAGSYQGPDGTILQTNSPTLTPGPDWIQLQPIRH